MQGRHGFYIEEANVVVLFIIIRGNNLHQGTLSSYDPATKAKWVAVEQFKVVWRLAGPENRIFFVQYYATAACLRIASMSISRPLHFGNQGTPVAHKDQQKNFSEDGHWLLGNATGRANRLGREFAFQFFNGLRRGSLKLNCSMANLLHLISFINEDGVEQRLTEPDFDVVIDAEYVQEWRGWYAWHRQQSARHYIRITKEERASVQNWLKLRNTDTTSFPLTERRTVINQFIQQYTDAPLHIIERVVGRKIIAGKVVQL
jgi:hypothetical protein